MKLEKFLEIIEPRPSFWFRAWLFFFLLINRKEGRRLIETLIEEEKTLIKKNDEYIQIYDRFIRENAETGRKADALLKGLEERRRELAL
jgi:hypothetical protein